MNVNSLEEFIETNGSVINDDSLALAHHGILGQKWGRLNGPPYPLDAQDHSKEQLAKAEATGTQIGKSSGKGSSEKMTWSEKRKAKKLQKQRKASLEKARVAKATKAEEKKRAEAQAKKDEEDKQKAIKSGDYEAVKKYSSKMTESELREAVSRVQLNSSLNNYAPKDTAKAEKTITDKINSTANTINSVTNVAKKGMDAWNTFATIYNTFNGDDNDLPKFDGSKVKTAEQKAKDKVLDKILKSGDSEKIANKQSDFSTQQLTDAVKRMNAVNALKKDAESKKTSSQESTSSKTDEKTSTSQSNEAKNKTGKRGQRWETRETSTALSVVGNQSYDSYDGDAIDLNYDSNSGKWRYDG